MKLRFLYLTTFFIFCFFVLPHTTQAAILNRAPNNLGLVGYWPMNEGVGTQAGDFSGKGNPGNLVGGSAWATGKFGKTVSFVSSTYVALTNDSLYSLTSATAEITLSAWIKTTSADASIFGLRNGGSGSPVLDFQLGGDGIDNTGTGIPSFLVRDDGGVGLTHVHGTSAINDGVWHHVVATRNSSKSMKLYVDGVEVGSGTDTMSAGATVDTAAIGAELINGSIPIMNGLIDDARIYNRALLGAEVASLYKAGATNITKVTSVGSGSSNCAVSTSCAITYSATPGNLLVVSGRSLNATDAGILSVTDNAGSGYTSALNTKFSGNHITFAFYTCAAKSGVTTINANVTTASEMAVQVLEYSGMAKTNCFDQVSSVNNGTTNLLATTLALTPARSAELSVGIFQHTTNGSSAFSSPSNGYTCVNRFDTVDNDTTAQCYKYLASAVPVQAYAAHALGGNQWWGHQLLFKSASIATNSSQNKTGGTLDSGLVGLWSFNGADMNWGTNEALDRSGNGYNADIINMSTTTSPVPGKIGQALKFDGTTNSVDTGYIANNADDYYTMSAWVKTTYSGTDVSVIDNYDTSTPYLALYMISSGAMQTYARNNSYGWSTTGNTLINDNVWHHVAMTMSTDGVNDILTIYVDGVQDGTPATRAIGVGGDFDSGSTFHIGSDGQLNYKFPGSIDEARMYNRALTATEIKQLYNMGR